MENGSECHIFILGGPKEGVFFWQFIKQWQPCLVLKKRTCSKTLLFELFCRDCQLIKWDALKFSLELFVGWHEMRWAFLETKMNCLFRAEAGKSEKVYSFFAWTKFCIHNVFMKYFFESKSQIFSWRMVSSFLLNLSPLWFC